MMAEHHDLVLIRNIYRESKRTNQYLNKKEIR